MCPGSILAARTCLALQCSKIRFVYPRKIIRVIYQVSYIHTPEYILPAVYVLCSTYPLLLGAVRTFARSHKLQHAQNIKRTQRTAYTRVLVRVAAANYGALKVEEGPASLPWRCAPADLLVSALARTDCPTWVELLKYSSSRSSSSI